MNRYSRKRIYTLITCISSVFGVYPMDITKKVTIEIGTKQYSVPRDCTKHSTILKDYFEDRNELTISLDDEYVPANIWETVMQPAIVNGPEHKLLLNLCEPKDLIKIIKAADFLGIEYLRTAALKETAKYLKATTDTYLTDEKARAVWNRLDENSIDELAQLIHDKPISWTQIDIPKPSSFFVRWFLPRLVLLVTYNSDGVLFLGLAYGTLLKKVGELVSGLGSHEGTVTALTLSPDGQLLASGSVDTRVKLWDVKTGECLKTFCHERPVSCIAFNAKSTQFISGSVDSTGTQITLRNVPSGKIVNAWEEDYVEMAKVQFINDDTEIITTFGKGRVSFYKVVGQVKFIDHLNDCGTYGTVSSVQSLPNSTIFFLGSCSGWIQVVDMATKELPVRYDCIEKSRRCSLALSPDNKILACAFNNTIALYQVYTSQLTPGALKTITTLKDVDGSVISSIAFSPDGKQLISASDKGVRVWNLNGPKFTLDQAVFVHNALQQGKVDTEHNFYQLLTQEQKNMLLGLTKKK